MSHLRLKELSKSDTMKVLLLGFCLIYFSVTKALSKPQITKLFPIQENTDVLQQSTNETKPLDRFLGKLRATYNFVFRKPENTNNVEKILAMDALDPNMQALKLILSNRMPQNLDSKENSQKFQPQVVYLKKKDDCVNDIQPLDRLEPLESLELEDEIENVKDRDVEIITPQSSFQFPVTLSRHLVDWLGSLLGITYGVYSKLTKAIYRSNSTAIWFH